jgi:antitoxin CcdA
MRIAPKGRTMTAPKRAANLSVRADLLEEARARKINLSQTLEVALAAEIKKRREDEWREQNKEAIAAYGRLVEREGLLSDSYRNFMRGDD